MALTGGHCTWNGGLVLASAALVPATGIRLGTAYC
jgi:hypothetical protein